VRSEQILYGNIVLDEDNKLSTKEIKTILEDLGFEVTNSNSKFFVKINNKEYIFLIKNITYLGNPHPIYKKRIQLSAGWQHELHNENCFLFGIYSYKETLLFVNFDKTNYKDRNLNNSSAHVYSIDLLKGYEFGVFQKTDTRGNKISVIRYDKLVDFIENNFVINPEIQLFTDFYDSLNKKWFGIDCYNEMINANYNNKFQPEWAGFYSEFLFEKFLQNNPQYLSICEFIHNKKKSQIDLDLFFRQSYFFGDLKTHSIASNAILGNDKNNILQALQKYGKIWYIVLNHTTIMDKDRGFEVTRFWNTIQNKSNLYSYSTRMKHSIEIQNIEILEINRFNIGYLSDFNQGINSNGNNRNVKIKINKSLKDNFLIFKKGNDG